MKKRNALFFVAGIITVLLQTISYAQEARIYSIEVRDAPLSDVIRFLANLKGISVVMPDNVTGVITGSFPSTTLDTTLNAILETSDFGHIVSNGVLRIAPRKLLEDLGRDLAITTIGLKNAKAKDIEKQIKALLSPRGSVTVDDRTNSVTLRDLRSNIAGVYKLLESIDRADRQVLIEAKIIQASTTFLRDLGVQWGLNSNNPGSVSVGGLTTLGKAQSGNLLNLANQAPNVSSTLGGGLALSFGPFSNTSLDIQLTAAETKGDVSILARPSIVTMNNQAAKIRSGRTISIITAGSLSIGGAPTPSGGTSSTGGANGSIASGSSTNLSQIETGITLTTTPQITQDNKINLQIDITSSDIDNTTAYVTGVPVIIDNKATTTVLLRDGETTVIAGLFQLQKSDSSRGLPWIRNIPILNYLFGGDTVNNYKKDLIVFLTPRIVKECEPAGVKAGPDDLEKRGNEELQPIDDGKILGGYNNDTGAFPD